MKLTLPKNCGTQRNAVNTHGGETNGNTTTKSPDMKMKVEAYLNVRPEL